MSSPDPLIQSAVVEDPAVGNRLFPGDTGDLPLDTRRTLVQLLAGPSLDGRRHSKLWTVLIRDEAAIRSRLSELFLELVTDIELQVAFTRQAAVGDLDAPALLRSAPLTFIDSALLMYLRQRLTEADARGERAVIDTGEMVEHLAVYERAVNTDHSGYARRCHNSIEKFKKHSILQKIRSSDDRYEISPTLKLLFSVESIKSLTQLYERMAASEAPNLADEESEP
jgi:hypothetical protein